MGMFDYVNFEMECPNCKQTVGPFQSKDRQCDLAWLEPDDVDNFYAGCRCGEWIEFTRPHNLIESRDKPIGLDEVLSMGFRCNNTEAP